MSRWDVLQQEPRILLDGALGTQLERGAPAPVIAWSLDALIFRPARVRALHRRYCAAGADVVTTNAFRTNRRTLQRADWAAAPRLPREVRALAQRGEWDELEALLSARAVALAREAREAAGTPGAAVAGNLAPLEDCFSPQLAPDARTARREHAPKARALAEAGADLILVETMGTRREAEGALAAALDVKLPVWLSVTGTARGALLDGTPAAEVLALARAHTPSHLAALMVNCVPPEAVAVWLPALLPARDWGLRVGAFPNVQAADGRGGWRRRPALTPAALVAFARRWAGWGATIVGGCCGTTPADVRALKAGWR